ncbi:hypothetical protein LT40_15680 [Pseudomonas rhizosphaerae]|uniref:Uncharacterized protein n=1 Tax=Pseudomonas rhizosphaerae TaxID=216142 RepID=A0A089ZR46_9PSED|nr:hypothetical protein LT40_15680 [Pseudomonas rhizosphaerae]
MQLLQNRIDLSARSDLCQSVLKFIVLGQQKRRDVLNALWILKHAMWYFSDKPPKLVLLFT